MYPCLFRRQFDIVAFGGVSTEIFSLWRKIQFIIIIEVRDGRGVGAKYDGVCHPPPTPSKHAHSRIFCVKGGVLLAETVKPLSNIGTAKIRQDWDSLVTFIIATMARHRWGNSENL